MVYHIINKKDGYQMEEFKMVDNTGKNKVKDKDKNVDISKIEKKARKSSLPIIEFRYKDGLRTFEYKTANGDKIRLYSNKNLTSLDALDKIIDFEMTSFLSQIVPIIAVFGFWIILGYFGINYSDIKNFKFSDIKNIIFIVLLFGSLVWGIMTIVTTCDYFRKWLLTRDIKKSGVIKEIVSKKSKSDNKQVYRDSR